MPDALEDCHSWNFGLLRNQPPVPSRRPTEVDLWLSWYAIVEIQARIFLLLCSENVSARPIPTISRGGDVGTTFQMFVHLLDSLVCSDDRFAEKVEHLLHFACSALPTQCQKGSASKL